MTSMLTRLKPIYTIHQHHNPPLSNQFLYYPPIRVPASLNVSFPRVFPFFFIFISATTRVSPMVYQGIFTYLQLINYCTISCCSWRKILVRKSATLTVFKWSFRILGVLGRVNISGHWRLWWMMVDDDNDGQMVFGDLGGLKLLDICLTGVEKTRKTLPRKLIPTGDRTRACCATGVHATTWPTAVGYMHCILSLT